jgi:membrane protein
MSLISVCKKIVEKSIKNDIFSLANAVSFKFILGIFPFLIAAITLLSYFSLDITGFILRISNNVPSEIIDMIDYFVEDVVNVKSISLLSTNFIIALLSASAAFHQMIKAINKIYNVKETRNFFVIRLYSLVLVVVFVSIILVSMYGFLFGDKINAFLVNRGIFKEIPPIMDTFTDVTVNQIIIFVGVMILYKISPNARVKFGRSIPGAVFVLVSWFCVSKLFKLYINNFASYSIIYGSLGTIFIFALWLNLLAYIILFGAQINSVLCKKGLCHGKIEDIEE